MRVSVFLVGILFFNTGCRVNWEAQFNTAVTNENFVGAKQLMRQQLAADNFNFPKETGRARAYYRIAYAHGKLAEYDSMKVALDSSLAQDANFSRLKRELIEYFSLEEFNKAVNLYNNFFFDKAIAQFKIAVGIVGSEAPYEEYAAIIYRCLAYAEASNNNVETALEYCHKASNLGDALSKRVLLEWEKEKKMTPPNKLEPREKPTITI